MDSGLGTAAASDTAFVTARDVVPNATGKPAITGPAQVGMTLTAGTADIMDADGLTTPGYTYQWLKEGSNISGQTGSTYTPTSSDIGENVQVKVDFTDDATNTESLTSDETTAVVPAAITCPTPTTWCSMLTTGHGTLTSDDEFDIGLGTTVGTPPESFGSLHDATFTHLGVNYTVTQFFVNSDSLYALFATSPNLPDDAAGLTLSVQQVSGQRDIPLAGKGYSTNTILPATTKAWQLQFALNSSVDAPLTAPLLRGFDSNYDPYDLRTDEDTEVTIWLTFANRAATGAPTISGTAQVGETLTAAIGDIADPDGLPTTFPGDYTIQWLRVDADGMSNQTSIATNTTTYTPVAADAGKKIKVQLTFTDGGGTSETLTSAAYPSSGTIVTPSTPVTPPGKVFGVNISPSDQTLQVSWTQVTGATGYKVQWKSGGQSYGSGRQATISSGSTTSRTISNLQNGTEYTVRVIATKSGASDGTPSDDAMGTPTAAASSHVQYVYSDWRLKPSGINGGEQFRLIFLSSTKRSATSHDISTYNNWIRDLASEGHPAIRRYKDGFNVVGCTATVDSVTEGLLPGVDARDNTDTTYTSSNKGVPIYWLNGNKVADDYEDFYDGDWDEERNAHDKDERGITGPNTAQAANYPWTGCEHDGTQAFAGTDTEALGNIGDEVIVGRPNSTSDSDRGPISSGTIEDSSDNRPMYGLSPVFQVIQLPSNAGTLTTGGTPRSDTLGSSDTGHYWRVELHKNGRFRIDVKGSESSQYGGTITNP